MRTDFLIAFFILSPLFGWSQFQVNTACEEADEMVIERDGIHPVSKNSFDTIAVNIRSNAVLFRYRDNVRSFWYKIYAAVDSKVTFEILPSRADNRYNYFLYHSKGDLSIQEIYSSNVEPVRASLYTKKTKEGTGLSLSSTVSSNDSCPRNIEKIVYETPYQAALTVKKGDVLMLNVYHLTGTDCGYHFVLKSNQNVQEFHSIYESCYKEEEVEKIMGHFLNLDKFFYTGKGKAHFIVKDSIRQSSMDAEVVSIKQGKENSFTNAQANGFYDVDLEINTKYQITFSAFGYGKKTISFFTKDSIRSYSQDVSLSLLKEGDNFVMDKIYFYPNTYSMKPGSNSQIDQLAGFLIANPGIKIEVQGHTSGNKRIRSSYDNKDTILTEGCFKGSARKLSQYRAELVQKHLIKRGVSPDRLVPHGYGGNRMIHRKPKNQEEADKNIRVGVLILSQTESVSTSATAK